LHDDLICKLCNNPLYEPLWHPIESCQTMFCKFCTLELKTCPHCLIAVVPSDFQQVPRLIWDKVDSLHVKCPTCSEVMERRNLFPHTPKCATPCPLGCDKKILPKEAAEHEKDCEFVIVVCPAQKSLCPWQGKRKDLADHIKKCLFTLGERLILVTLAEFQGKVKKSSEQIQKIVDENIQETAKVRKIVNRLHPFIASRRKQWTLTMSSQVNFAANTYAALVDTDLTKGASTLYSSEIRPNFSFRASTQWIQATFNDSVIVTSVTLGGGSSTTIPWWRPEDLNGKTLQYSDDGNNWRDALTIRDVEEGKMKKFTMPMPIIAKYWRLYGLGSVATAAFIFE